MGQEIGKFNRLKITKVIFVSVSIGMMLDFVHLKLIRWAEFGDVYEMVQRNSPVCKLTRMFNDVLLLNI